LNTNNLGFSIEGLASLKDSNLIIIAESEDNKIKIYNRSSALQKTFNMNHVDDEPKKLAVINSANKIMAIIEKHGGSMAIAIYRSSQADGSTPIQEVNLSSPNDNEDIAAVNLSDGGAFIYDDSNNLKIINLANGTEFWARGTGSGDILELKSEYTQDKWVVVFTDNEKRHLFSKTAAVCN
jgi:WD40 repeat protein